jgi:hypothetical protein
VTGDLEAPAIMMEEGAQLNGMVRMGSAAKAKTPSTASKSSDTGSENATGTGDGASA